MTELTDADTWSVNIANKLYVLQNEGMQNFNRFYLQNM